jgi:hypothetical protein
MRFARGDPAEAPESVPDVRQNPRMDEPELLSNCDACNKPIEGATGRLWVDNTAVAAYRRARREWTAAHEVEPGGGVSYTFGEAFDLPDRVTWQAHHIDCDPDPDANAYVIESNRISTWADLAHWTAHLMKKSWFSATDWGRLLEGVAEGSGSRLRPAKKSTLHV